MLPKIDIPIYETKLISSGEVIRFRPFLVKEQKLFLMAGESDDPKETVKTIKQVLRNCVLDDIDIENMATFDIEYLFLQLRARSVGEIANLRFTCNNNISETEKCGNAVKIDVNVLEINPEKNKDHSNKIQITDKVGVVLKYPTFNSLDISNLDTDNIEQILEIIVSCIDYVYDADSVYYAKDTPKQELVEFIENLKQADLEKISVFFNTLPKIKKDVDFNCEKCGYHEVLTLEGIQSFFG
jgi:DNA-directed RNA polymerase subunit M/transcription elongation factor TFIIS